MLSSIEYRVLASMGQQKKLMLEFNDPVLDYHTYQASRMFSILYSLVSKALRSQSKGINFGLPYGMGDSSLGTRIFGVRHKGTQQKASGLRRKFFQG
ncbi:DNA polymerase [Actinomycetes bacterium NPDC127524]